MKVRDLMVFLSSVNPEARIGILDDDHLLYELELYGYGGSEGVAKMNCEHISLITNGKYL